MALTPTQLMSKPLNRICYLSFVYVIGSPWQGSVYYVLSITHP